MPTTEQIEAANQQEIDRLIQDKADLKQANSILQERVGQLEQQITDYQDKLDKVMEVIKTAKTIGREDDTMPMGGYQCTCAFKGGKTYCPVHAEG